MGSFSLLLRIIVFWEGRDNEVVEWETKEFDRRHYLDRVREVENAPGCWALKLEESAVKG